MDDFMQDLENMQVQSQMDQAADLEEISDASLEKLAAGGSLDGPSALEKLGDRIQDGLEHIGGLIEDAGKAMDDLVSGVKDLTGGAASDRPEERASDDQGLEAVRELSADLPAGAEQIGQHTWMDGAGIIHNGAVDSLYDDLMSTFQSSFKDTYGPDAWMDGAGIIHDSKIDSDAREVMEEEAEGIKEAYGEGAWMDGAGIIHNDAFDLSVDELTRDLQAENAKLEEQIEYNWEHGIYPPTYDGFVSNPYHDPAGMDGSMAVMDAFCGMMTMDAPDYVGYVPTAEESMRDFEFNQGMADSYFSDGLTGMAGTYDSRAEQNLKDIDFYNSING